MPGQILHFEDNDRGGFYVVISPDKTRYRADRALFGSTPTVGSVLLFEAGSEPPKKSHLRKIKRVLFATDPEPVQEPDK